MQARTRVRRLGRPLLPALVLFTAAASAQSWQPIPNAVLPPAGPTALQRRLPPSPVFPNTVIRFDETTSTTFALDLTTSPPSWPTLTTIGSPPTRMLSAMAGTFGSTVLFGGLDSSSGILGDTWRLLPSTTPGVATWTQWTAAPQPAARILPAMAAVPSQVATNPGFVFVHGGFDGTALRSDLWRFDTTSGWSQVTSGTTPPSARVSHCLCEGGENTLVLFGGFDGANHLGDTWLYSFTSNNWAQLNPATPPPARRDASMVYDELRGVVVLTGGNDSTTVFADVWELRWDTTAPEWRQVGAAGSPSGPFPVLFRAPQTGQLLATSTGLDEFVPSPVRWTPFPDAWFCSANGTSPLLLNVPPHELPLIGQTFDMNVADVVSGALLVGGFEFTGPRTPVALGCNCESFLTGGATTVNIANVGPTSPWSLAIPNLGALLGLTIDLQAYHVDGSSCWLKATQLVEITMGF